MHMNITGRKLGEEALRRFVVAIDNISDALYLVDRSSMSYIHVNDAACRMEKLDREELLASRPEEAFAISREELERIYDSVIADGSDKLPVEICRRYRDGTHQWLELRRHAHCWEDRWTIVSLVRDITGRKEADDRITHLNRVYAMLSGINSLIVRVRSRHELFTDACQVAVTEGRFSMTWIGLIDQTAMKVIIVASAGVDEELLASINVLFSSPDGGLSGETLTARAIREKKAMVSNDSQSDARLFTREKHAPAGIRSMAILPLIVADSPVGVIALYADENEFFHDGELKLLVDLTRDIAFAIDNLDKQDRLHYLAYYDELTGLANRSLFHNRLSQSLRARRGEQMLLATVLLDLERFRRINETLGRQCGDQLLQDVGLRLQSANDTVARIGVDMFGIFVRGARTAAEINRALDGIMEACFSEPFIVGGQELRVMCRAGVALYPGDGVDADVLLRNAEAALRRSKRSGERIVFYAREMNARVSEALAIETRLRRAIDRREFILHYQPKIALGSGRTTGAEALIRWQDAERGLIPPGLFIPVLEETGMILEVGLWVVEQAFVDLNNWAKHGARVPRVAVNVSAIQLRAKDFVDSIVEEIRCGGNRPDWLELEITESVVMGNIEESHRKLSLLRDLGVTIAIDDFGTGYSSLSYLSKLPLDSLKIDRSFVSGLSESSEAGTIVSTIISLAHGLRLKVVAEGVETLAQSNMLELLRCDEVQGYFYGRPVPSDTFAAEHLSTDPTA